MALRSVFDVLDATTLCSRAPLTDPSVWARPLPARVRHMSPADLPASSGFSWRSWARNPQALLLTGLIGAGVVRDALLSAR